MPKTTWLNFAPPDDVLPSQWAERYRALGPPSQEKGPWRNIRTPYLPPIMDTLVLPHVETVVLCKPAQIAGTEIALNIAGYFSHREPCPILLTLADEDTSKYMCEKRLQTIYRNSPKLKHLIKKEAFTQKELTLTNESYIGVAWASSVSRLASRPYRIVLLDEVDKPGYYKTTREASPITLAIERTETFFNRKIFILSTPTIEEGNIWQELKSCDVIYDFHVPCPYCGQFQPLRWSMKYSSEFEDGKYRTEEGKLQLLGSVVWDGGRNATQKQIQEAGYQCGTCEKAWTSTQKNIAVEQGKMVSREEFEGKPKKVGFHLNRLYSLLGNSGDIPKLVSDWIEALKGSNKKLQGFINSTLAEPFRLIITTSNEASILKARCDLPPQTIPQEAIALTAGVDVQKRGFWFVIRAWARNYTSWLIHYGHLSIWEEVETLLFDTYYPVDGMPGKGKRIWRAGIDTGGGEGVRGVSTTEETEIWVRDNGTGRGCRVWGTKGANKELQGILKVGKVRDQTPSGKPLRGGLQIISLDTHKLKDSYHYRLQQAIDGGPRAAYLHSGTGVDYASHILAEEKRIDGRGVEYWHPVSVRNDYLDCECIAAACADPEWPGGGVGIIGKQKTGRRVISRGIHDN